MDGLQTVIFSDGSQFFDDLANRFVKHDRGLFILTPSGAGKTHFCKRQEEQHWIDGDDLYRETGAQPPLEYEWWNKGPHVINRVEQRCDVITSEAIDRGFWIMSSINYWLKPYAIVIPSIDTLMDQIKKRQNEGYDGGLKDEHFEQLIVHIGIIRDWKIKHDVPEFKSIEEAVNFLTNSL